MKQYNENPFYDNHIFKEIDLSRCLIKWWHYPLIIFLPTYIQLMMDMFINIR